MTASSDDLLEAVARGIARRTADIQKAESQFAAFAIDGAEAPDSGQVNGEYFVLRVLSIMGQAGVYDVVSSLVEAESMQLKEIASLLGRDRLAAVDAVSLLTQIGLASRQLDVDRVQATELAKAMVQLVDELARRIAERLKE
ncbi:MAG: hypothetical protein OEZ54_12400 [Gemmatimonadota bacterium]|nr:hypothetical protein [Gemmatimonadota bacterium]